MSFALVATEYALRAMWGVIQYLKYIKIASGAESEGGKPVAGDLYTEPVTEAVVSTAAPTFPSHMY